MLTDNGIFFFIYRRFNQPRRRFRYMYLQLNDKVASLSYVRHRSLQPGGINKK